MAVNPDITRLPCCHTQAAPRAPACALHRLLSLCALAASTPCSHSCSSKCTRHYRTNMSSVRNSWLTSAPPSKHNRFRGPLFSRTESQLLCRSNHHLPKADTPAPPREHSCPGPPTAGLDGKGSFLVYVFSYSTGPRAVEHPHRPRVEQPVPPK